MYRALSSVAPEKSARGFIERQQSSVFSAEIHLAVFHDRLTAELKRIWYRPHHATSALIKRISSTIEAARKYFPMTERECAAQRSHQRRHPLSHSTFATERTQCTGRFLSVALDECFG